MLISPDIGSVEASGSKTVSPPQTTTYILTAKNEEGKTVDRKIQIQVTISPTPNDIVGMGIAGSNDHVYVWFRDGTVSSGTSNDLDKYRSPYKYYLD